MEKKRVNGLLGMTMDRSSKREILRMESQMVYGLIGVEMDL
jgi:hypothetical protein